METKVNQYNKALEMCCGFENKYRKWMEKPFRIDNYTYATDSYTLLRVPNSLLDTHYDELHIMAERTKDTILKMFEAEECPYTFAQQSLRDLFNSLPQEDEYEPREECPECEGVGELDCPHCGSTYQCDNCGGEGFLDKRKLTGRKKPKNTPVKINKHVFRSDKLFRMLDIIETLGYVGDIGFCPNHKTPIFNLGKCDLVLMPTLTEHEVELYVESLRKI